MCSTLHPRSWIQHPFSPPSSKGCLMILEAISWRRCCRETYCSEQVYREICPACFYIFFVVGQKHAIRHMFPCFLVSLFCVCAVIPCGMNMNSERMQKSESLVREKGRYWGRREPQSENWGRSWGSRRHNFRLTHSAFSRRYGLFCPSFLQARGVRPF